MKKSDYNIEFAHVYVNENFANEHYRAAQIAERRVREIKKQEQSCVLVLLIDDYNPSNFVLNTDNFLERLDKMGVKPDYVVYESEMVTYGDRVLEELNNGIRKQYLRYIKKHGKYPCSFLIAIWYLLRLGFLDIKPIIKSLASKPFIAHKIINILPRKYKSVENKALDIINSTRFKDLVKDKIEYIFY
jgi:hypothetical protein